MISIFLVIFELEKHLTRPQTQPNVFIWMQDHADETPLASIKMERNGGQQSL